VRIATSVGRNTLYILIVHVVLGGYITLFLNNFLESDYIYHLIAKCFIEVVMGVLVGEMITNCKKMSLKKEYR